MTPDTRGNAAGVSRICAGRLMRLTSLATDLLQAILEGHEPAGLSLGTVHEGVPERWDQQRRTLSCGRH